MFIELTLTDDRKCSFNVNKIISILNNDNCKENYRKYTVISFEIPNEYYEVKESYDEIMGKIQKNRPLEFEVIDTYRFYIKKEIINTTHIGRIGTACRPDLKCMAEDVVFIELLSGETILVKGTYEDVFKRIYDKRYI